MSFLWCLVLLSSGFVSGFLWCYLSSLLVRYSFFWWVSVVVLVGVTVLVLHAADRLRCDK